MAPPEMIRKPRQARRLAVLVPQSIEPALRQRGFASAAIIAEWREIVGAALAACSAPVEIRWPKRPAKPEDPRPLVGRMQEKAEGATLVVLCPGAFALEVQMASANILEAANRRLGFRAITRLEIRQGALPNPAPAPAGNVIPEPLIEAVRTSLADITDEALRRALAQLGAGITRRETGRKLAG